MASRPVFLLALLTFAGLPPGVKPVLRTLGVTEASFGGLIQKIEASTAERERTGENDHLIFYILQSQHFTSAPPIEPALGAAPGTVQRRFRDFLRAPVKGERMTYFRGLVPAAGALDYLSAEYARAVRSLQEKEFDAKPDFYQSRGHSTDTQVSANYAVWTALRVLRDMQPGLKIERVLIVGPGLDFAPRTALDERAPPQSYQPYAVLDALLGLGLSKRPGIDCVDINDRVVRFIRDFARAKPPVLRIAAPAGGPEFLDYFRHLGNASGEVETAHGGGRTLRIRQELAEAVTASKFNVLTERRADLLGAFDLVVATNVLLYFNDTELLLALANIGSMLAPGGHFIHNEIRTAIDEYAAAAGLAAVQARTVRIGEGPKGPLFDAFAIYRKPLT